MLFQCLCRIVWDSLSSPITWLKPFDSTSYSEIFKVLTCLKESNWYRELKIWEPLIGSSCNELGSNTYIRDMICYETFLIEMIICIVCIMVFWYFKNLDD